MQPIDDGHPEAECEWCGEWCVTTQEVLYTFTGEYVCDECLNKVQGYKENDLHDRDIEA